MKKTLQLSTPRKMKIILWDIETLPNLKEVMKVFPSLSNYPGLTLKGTINSIICVGYKEFGTGKVKTINAWDYKQRWKKDMNDDYAVVKAAYEVLKDADVVVTHNGKRFDWKFLQTRLLYHGLTPLPKIIHIDTCQEAKKNLYMFNNRMNTLAQFLTDVEKKENGGWGLWVDVSQRKKRALKLMSQYCAQDVRVLEKVFKVLRPLITSLPNKNMFSKNAPVCPTCGGRHLVKKGERITKEGRRQQYQCKDCGSWSSEHKAYPRA